jgi:S-adenosylmethionine hydrolase
LSQNNPEEEAEEEVFEDSEDSVEDRRTDGPLRGKVVALDRFGGVACHVVEDDGEEQAVVVMVGDDRRYTVSREDCKELAREAYCGVCGQIGCGHDGLERDS